MIKSSKDNFIPKRVKEDKKIKTSNSAIDTEPSIENKIINKKKEESSSEGNQLEIITSRWKEIIDSTDKINSKLSSFLEETSISDYTDNILILNLDNGNNFIKKVLNDDKKIIIDVINDICGFIVEISIKVSEIDKDNKVVKKITEKEHPLLEDAIKIFNGKIIS